MFVFTWAVQFCGEAGRIAGIPVIDHCLSARAEGFKREQLPLGDAVWVTDYLMSLIRLYGV